MLGNQDPGGEAVVLGDDQTTKEIIATATLLPEDTRVGVDTTAGAITLTLPNVVQAKGKEYFIYRRNTSVNDVTIADQNEGISAIADLVIEVIHGWACVRSNGIQWLNVDSKLT